MTVQTPWHKVGILFALASIFASGTPALAQPTERPIGRYVVDVRGSVVPFKSNIELAQSRQMEPLDTPGLGMGLEVGAHLYFLRFKAITLGVGASFHSSLADRQPNEFSPDPDGPTLRKRFTAIAPQLSFNFGGSNGWSYISGGIAPTRLSLFPLNDDKNSQRSSNTLNYGGGVRWFTSEHLAFSIDFRLYAISPLSAISPQEKLPGQPYSPRMTQMVLSIGTSFK